MVSCQPHGDHYDVLDKRNEAQRHFGVAVDTRAYQLTLFYLNSVHHADASDGSYKQRDRRNKSNQRLSVPNQGRHGNSRSKRAFEGVPNVEIDFPRIPFLYVIQI